MAMGRSFAGSLGHSRGCDAQAVVARIVASGRPRVREAAQCCDHDARPSIWTTAAGAGASVSDQPARNAARSARDKAGKRDDWTRGFHTLTFHDDASTASGSTTGFHQ